MTKIIEIPIGFKSGRLTVLAKSTIRSSYNTLMYSCICECGNNVLKSGRSLRNHITKSCGCLRIERVRESTITHGNTVNKKWTKEYRTWVDMMTRCYNKNSTSYKYYGERGIKVCDKWHNYINFSKDMGVKPSGYLIDRINVNGDYEPGNCKWSTIKESARNKRSNKLISVVFPDGKVDIGMCVELVEKYKFSKTSIYGSLKNNNHLYKKCIFNYI